MPLTWLLEAVQLSKQGWYYAPQTKEENVLPLIKEVLSEYSFYGYRRVTKALQRNGHAHNHKKIRRIMKESNLKQVKRSPRVPRTTNSHHTLLVYENSIADMAVFTPSVVWVSDITYVWTAYGWSYLALVMDQGSRRVVGWSVGTTLNRSLAIDALNAALVNAPAPQFHHSDRGVQYCSHDYIRILKDHNITPSMAAVGVSVDNPYAESLNRSIKVEEVYKSYYETVDDVRISVQSYVEMYNTKRLHSSLGYIPPMEYEANYYKQLAKVG